MEAHAVASRKVTKILPVLNYVKAALWPSAARPSRSMSLENLSSLLKSYHNRCHDGNAMGAQYWLEKGNPSVVVPIGYRYVDTIIPICLGCHNVSSLGAYD